MLTIDALRDYGANVTDGLARCMNNEAFYLRLVNMAVQDGNYGKLYDAVEQKDFDAAFKAAHALKGVLGNLSLTPLGEPVSKLTELLRSHADADYAAYIALIKEQHEKLLALCKE